MNARFSMVIGARRAPLTARVNVQVTKLSIFVIQKSTMKNTVASFFLLFNILISGFVCAQNDSESNPDIIPPIYPGCEMYESIKEQQKCFQNKLPDFFKNTIKYPKKAAAKKIQGTVCIRFTVDVDGSICDVEVEKSVYKTLDKEAIRAVKLLPKFTPGRADGEISQVFFIIPVNFQLQ